MLRDEGTEAEEPASGDTNLTRSATTGFAWLTAARWSIRLAHLVAMVILARLLTPAEFGIVALVKVLSNFLVIGTLGLQTAAVRQRELPPFALDVAWTVDRFITGSLLAVIFVLGAPLLAGLFKAPDASVLIASMGAVTVIASLENNAIVDTMRRLDYRRQFVLEAANGLGMLVAVVPLAFVLRSAWAFVFAYGFGRLVRTIVSYIVYPHVPRIRFHRETFRELFSFGRWMLGLRLVRISRNQIDQLLLGGLLGPARLGYFQIGSRMMTQVTADAYMTARRTLFPIYARVQNDPERLARSYTMVLASTWLLLLPACALLYSLAEPLILLLFGAKWLPATPVAQVLAIAIAFRITAGTSHPLFMGTGRPYFELFMSLLFMATFVPLAIWLTGERGVTGTAEAVLLAELVQMPVWLLALRKTVDIRPRSLVGPALYAVAVAAPVFASGLAVQWWLGGAPAAAVVFAGLFVAGLAYALTLYVTTLVGAPPAVELVATRARHVVRGLRRQRQGTRS